MKAFIVAAVAALTAVSAPAMAQDFTGAHVGVIGGLDRQAGNNGLAYGAEAGIDAPLLKDVTVGVDATVEDSTLRSGPVKSTLNYGFDAKVGVKVLPRVQAFAKVGYDNAKFAIHGTGAAASFEGVRYGGGLEVAATKHLYTTIEYRRVDYSKDIPGRDSVLVGAGFRF